MEFEQHGQGPESGTGSHYSHRVQGLADIHVKKERLFKSGQWTSRAALGVSE